MITGFWGIIAWVVLVVMLFVMFTMGGSWLTMMAWVALLAGVLATESPEPILWVGPIYLVITVLAIDSRLTTCPSCSHRMSKYLHHKTDGIVRKCVNPNCEVQYATRETLAAGLPFWTRRFPSYRH